MKGKGIAVLAALLVAAAPHAWSQTTGISIASLSPSSAPAGSPDVALTLNGNFLAQYPPTVTWIAGSMSASLAVSSFSTTKISATIPASLLVTAGLAAIEVNQAGQFYSNQVMFTVTGGQPSLSSLSPASAPAGSPQLTLTINGANFTAGLTGAGSGTQVTWNGSVLATNFVSSSQLTATVPAALLLTPGTALVCITAAVEPAPLYFTISVPQAALTLSSISPNSISAGSPGFNLAVAGAGFSTGTVVSWNGTPLKTTFGSATQLTAAVPANLIAQPGTAQITAVNPAGGSSNALSLTIVTAAPTITGISPATVIAGGPTFTLTVTGTNFISGAAVILEKTSVSTTFVSPTEVTALVPASLISQPGPAQITVAVPNGVTSNAVTLTVTPAAPTITGLSPATVNAGGPGFTLTVSGANFISGSIVSLDNNPLTTSFVNGSQLTAGVPASLIAQAGAPKVTVKTPAGTTSNSLNLTVTSPNPRITSLSPSSVTAGGPGFVLTVNGTNFLSGATVNLRDRSLVTTFVSATQLTAMVEASQILQAGDAQIIVVNPGGGQSNPLPLTVAPPVPTISSISPATIMAGGPGFTLTVNGGPFGPGAQVSLNNVRLITTLVSSTQVTAVVPPNLVAQPGAAQITVANQGGSQSIAATLTITPAPPVINTISPVSARVGDPTFTLSLTGAGFVNASIVQWDGAPLGTTYVSPTQLSATIAAGRLILPATASVTVANPGPGGAAQISNAMQFTINPVVPAISSLAPNSANAGDPALALTVNGTGFIGLTTIQWNATALTTHLISGNQVTADVPASLLSTAGSVSITAVNPGNNISAPVTFTVIAKTPPAISSLSKTSAIAGDAAFTLTITGTGFVPGAVVNFSATKLPTTFVSATQLTATVSAGLLQVPGTYQVLVQQNGVSSGTVPFMVGLPAPPGLRLNPPAITGPAQQPSIDFGLNTTYPLPLTGTVTLTFVPDATVPVDDPSIQFASGGRTVSFAVPANSTAVPALQLQTGTVSGSITVAVRLMAAGQDVTPAGSSAVIKIGRAAPVIRKVTMVRNAAGVEVDVSGFSTPREVTQATFHFTPVPGSAFLASDFTLPVSSLFTTWYQTDASALFGSQFTFAQPFTILGDPGQVQSITVTLTNSTGTSAPVTSN